MTTEDPLVTFFHKVFNGYAEAETTIKSLLTLIEANTKYEESTFETLMSRLRIYEEVIQLEMPHALRIRVYEIDGNLKLQLSTLRVLITALRELPSIRDEKGAYQDREAQKEAIRHIDQAKEEMRKLLDKQNNLLKQAKLIS